MDTVPMLQIMVSTYAPQGLQRLARTSRPHLQGLEYLVCCQMATRSDVPQQLLQRNDFRFLFFREKGISRNRNRNLQYARGKWALFSDDDIDYSKEQLRRILKALSDEKEADVIAFRHITAPEYAKRYPAVRMRINSAGPKGYFVTAFELAVRLDTVRGRVWFNENFGRQGLFAGEENIFWESCRRAGLSRYFLPLDAGSHMHASTGVGPVRSDDTIIATGAVFRYQYRHWWWIRLGLSSLRRALRHDLPRHLLPYLIKAYCGAITVGAKAVREGEHTPPPPAEAIS